MRSIVAVAAGLLALALPAPALGQLTITSFTADSNGNPPGMAEAGSHPDSTVSMTFGGAVTDDVKDIIQHFPSGIIPNPEVIPKCQPGDFNSGSCPLNTQLGTTTLTACGESVPGCPNSLLADVTLNGQVYNLAVERPWVGGLGFIVASSPLAAPFTVRSALHGVVPDYEGNSPGLANPPGLTTSFLDQDADVFTQPTIPTARDYGLTGLSLNVPDHLDLDEGGPGPVVAIKIKGISYTLQGTPTGASSPYLTTTTACVQGYARLEATSYAAPTVKVKSPQDPLIPANWGYRLQGTNCLESELPYDPEPFDLVPGSTRTDTPTSYDISVNIPANETPKHQPHLKRGSITLPLGTALSPPAAQGLEGCADAQLGFGTHDAPSCPASSDIGDIVIESKNVDHQINGDFYLAQPTTGHNYRVFMAFPIVDDLWVKLDGESFPDSVTGQITTVFDDLPMLPFERFTISLRGGDRAVLVNPPSCGTHTLTSTLTPWTDATDFDPSFDETPTGSFTSSYNGAAAACPDPFPFDPVVAGSTNPLQAGSGSSLSLTLSGPDRDKLVKTLKTSLPAGLTGSLVGIPLCSVNAAAAGSCDAGSRIGTVDTAVGSGNDPLELPGTMYLAEPLQDGDPASLSIVVPARAGPFDFGNVVIRARIVLRSDVGLDVELVDDLPKIIEGIPIRLRTAGVSIDRSNFMRNPTSCAPLSLRATFTARDDTQKTATSPYQATGCGSLPFSPELRLRVEGETKKDGHPTLKALLTQPVGQANIAKSRVVIPDVIRPETLALQRPGGLCQEAQLAALACPSTSQAGTASATSPLLPEPLSGPVYIVQHAGNPLPKLVVLLDGRVAIRLEAQNEFQGIKIVNRFDALPDVPVTTFELTIRGGKNGILKNWEDLCSKDSRGEASFTSHSGKTVTDRPLIETPANTPGCVSTSAPRASVTVRGVKAGRPVVTMRITRGPSGANMRALTVNLPRSLRVNGKKGAKKALVRATRKLRRSQWTLTRKGVLTLRRLPPAGVGSVTLTLKKGALKATPALRRAMRKRKKRTSVSFRLRTTDVQGRRFSVTKKVRPRS